MDCFNILGSLQVSLGAIADQYKGHGKVARLVHVARHNKDLSATALKILYNYLQTDSNNLRCAKAVADVLSTIGSPIETEWIVQKQRRFSSQKEDLKVQLNKATSEVLASEMAVRSFGFFFGKVRELIVQNIYGQLADLAFDMGEFAEAHNYVFQQRDIMPEDGISLTPNKINSVLKLGLISYFNGKEPAARSFMEKIAPKMVDNEGNFNNDITATKIGTVLGICYLRHGNIRQALAVFLKLSPGLLDDVNDVCINLPFGCCLTCFRLLLLKTLPIM